MRKEPFRITHCPCTEQRNAGLNALSPSLGCRGAWQRITNQMHYRVSSQYLMRVSLMGLFCLCAMHMVHGCRTSAHIRRRCAMHVDRQHACGCQQQQGLLQLHEDFLHHEPGLVWESFARSSG